MTFERDQLIAYCATLAALVVIFIAALIIGALNTEMLDKMETFGLGTVCGGLIGALRFPSQRQAAAGELLPPPSGWGDDPAEMPRPRFGRADNQEM